MSGRRDEGHLGSAYQCQTLLVERDRRYTAESQIRNNVMAETWCVWNRPGLQQKRSDPIRTNFS